MFIDTHSHIYAEEFDQDREETIQRALAADVRQIILPDIDSTTRQSMLSLAEACPDMMYPTLGVHPTSVNESYKTEYNFSRNYSDKLQYTASGNVESIFTGIKHFTKNKLSSSSGS